MKVPSDDLGYATEAQVHEAGGAGLLDATCTFPETDDNGPIAKLLEEFGGPAPKRPDRPWEEVVSELKATMATSNVRVLVAGVHPPIVKLLAHWPECVGFEVQTAIGGQLALSLAHAFLPHLLILNVNIGFWMPDLHGFEVLRQLKEDPTTSHIPVVVVTADLLTASRISYELRDTKPQYPGVDSSCSDLPYTVSAFVPLPASAETVLEVVRRVLQH